MKSGVNIRYGTDEQFDTNLIVHHCFMDILQQIIDPLRVLSVGHKPYNISLLCQLHQILMNILQFPSNPHMSDSTLDTQGMDLPSQYPSP